MDINQELNEIIFKYHLDKYYPQYRKIVAAEEVLKGLVDEIALNGKKALFIGTLEDKLGYEKISNLSKQGTEIEFLLVSEVQRFPMGKWSDYDLIYLLPLEESEYCQRYFRMNNIPYKWIYDIFEQNGICFEMEFYRFNRENISKRWNWTKLDAHNGWRNSYQAELYFQKERAEHAVDRGEKRFFIEKEFFLSLAMRNFVLAEKYMEELINCGDAGNMELAWAEIQKLLSRIKGTLTEREQKDVVIYWLDAISYGQASDMKYLRSRMEQSVCFENAFTVCPYTNPTMRTMFCGVGEISGKGYQIKKITDGNSQILQFAREKGYKFRIISGPFSNGKWGKEYDSMQYHERYAPFSEICWDMLQNIMGEDSPLIIVAHGLEAHTPCICSYITDSSVSDEKIGAGVLDARRDLDEQLEFYDHFLPERETRIYMSDHGKDGFGIDRWHILLNVYQENVLPCKVRSLFSLIDFQKLLKDVIESKKPLMDTYAREYVEIELEPLYNRTLIKEKVIGRERVTDDELGMKGIITENHIYKRFATGKETINKWEKNSKIDVVGDAESDTSILLRCRQLTGPFPDEIMQDEKFKYSRFLAKLYMAQKRYSTRNIELINRAIEQSSCERIAIRMGGEHSCRLYESLTEENRGKIACFLDANSGCYCRKFGLPIYTLDEGMQQGIDAIILSSFDYLRMLREEANHYRADIRVIDIYKYLEENGVKVSKNFYIDINMPEEEWEIGFPQDE